MFYKQLPLMKSCQLKVSFCALRISNISSSRCQCKHFIYCAFGTARSHRHHKLIRFRVYIQRWDIACSSTCWFASEFPWPLHLCYSIPVGQLQIFWESSLFLQELTLCTIIIAPMTLKYRSCQQIKRSDWLKGVVSRLRQMTRFV